jgi:hypothetical protein
VKNHFKTVCYFNVPVKNNNNNRSLMELFIDKKDIHLIVSNYTDKSPCILIINNMDL